jgi:hypothetical protein
MTDFYVHQVTGDAARLQTQLAHLLQDDTSDKTETARDAVKTFFRDATGAPIPDDCLEILPTWMAYGLDPTSVQMSHARAVVRVQDGSDTYMVGLSVESGRIAMTKCLEAPTVPKEEAVAKQERQKAVAERTSASVQAQNWVYGLGDHPWEQEIRPYLGWLMHPSGRGLTYQDLPHLLRNTFDKAVDALAVSGKEQQYRHVTPQPGRKSSDGLKKDRGWQVQLMDRGILKRFPIVTDPRLGAYMTVLAKLDTRLNAESNMKQFVLWSLYPPNAFQWLADLQTNNPYGICRARLGTRPLTATLRQDILQTHTMEKMYKRVMKEAAHEGHLRKKHCVAPPPLIIVPID